MVYRTTLSPMVSLRRELDRFFDEASARVAPITASWTPAVDVRESKDAWEFTLEIPGVDPAQVEVTAEARVLKIRGQKELQRTPSDEDSRWLSTERISGAFERSFRLPAQVREDAIEARYAHGVLTVTVPKAEVPARRIEIKT
ncbi:MAG TPA: Hsp20/alpha crystallin family protein [Gemmatimonadaceae bacterium]|nr:Hsp20/alpha crystallin family protein [Gemmatimonadaceae bacterium]